jgi:hypothetical protein
MQICEYLRWQTRWNDATLGKDRNMLDAFASGIEEKLMSGCCGDNDFMTRYNEEGIKEISYDGGATWETDPAPDPRFIGDLRPPLAPIVGQDMKCIGAANIVAWLEQAANDTIDSMNEGGNATALVAAIMAILLLGTAGAAAPLLIGLAAALLLTTGTAFDTAMTEDVYERLRCNLFCNMEDDLTFTVEGWQAVKARIGADETGIAYKFLYDNVNSMGTLGLSNFARTGATEEADCSECGCDDTWCFNWSFDGDFATWSPVAQSGGAGVFGVATGSGIQHNSLRSPASNGSYWRRVDVDHGDFDNTIVTKISFIATITKGTENVSGDPIMQQVLVNGGTIWSLPFSTMEEGTDVLFEIEGNWTNVTSVRIFLASSVWTGSATYSGSVLLKEVTIWGEGNNPFGEDNCEE